jgi:heme/copper-type cytochrome/quinol oxidase subunit 3
VEVPYTVEVRRDTGLYNAQLGIWLFLASEVMLFGGLFSGYVLLRTGAESWPRGPERLNVVLATVNTALLVASGVTMGRSRAALRAGNEARGRRFLLATLASACGFVAIKLLEYREHVAAGELPSRDNFFAVYYTLTGLHVAHVLGGIVVMAYLAGPGFRMAQSRPERYAHRVDTTAIYWYFVDLVWLVLFTSLYLF